MILLYKNRIQVAPQRRGLNVGPTSIKVRFNLIILHLMNKRNFIRVGYGAISSF